MASESWCARLANSTRHTGMAGKRQNGQPMFRKSEIGGLRHLPVTRRVFAGLVSVAACLTFATAGFAAPKDAESQRPSATIIVAANSCAAQCRAEHNKCRLRTKGASSCDAALNACLQGCRQR